MVINDILDRYVIISILQFLDDCLCVHGCLVEDRLLDDSKVLLTARLYQLLEVWLRRLASKDRVAGAVVVC